MTNPTTRITIVLPIPLLKAVDRIVEAGRAQSRDDLIASAIRRELAAQTRASIDAEFVTMAEDTDYRRESETLEREFAAASWDAFAASER